MAVTRRINLQRPLEDYIQYFEHLTPRSIRFIEKIAEPEMRFVDPFNDVRGIDDVEAIFEKMFKDVDDPKFRVLDYAWGRQPDIVYLRWVFSFNCKAGRQEINGMSEVQFSDKGKVMSHTDYWDAAQNIYEKLPVVKTLLKFIRKKIAL